ncbi:ankyrin repeat-containing domain protein [Nemania sp. FL0916]|nr:ankyrin repeat-containing domain protein [Nemania sp. FL0916]
MPFRFEDKFHTFKDKLRGRKDGRESTALSGLVVRPSAANENRLPTKSSNEAPTLSAQEIGHKKPGIQLAPDDVQSPQSRTGSRPVQARAEFEQQKPYSVNSDMWNDALETLHKSKKYEKEYRAVKDHMATSDTRTRNSKSLASEIELQLSKVLMVQERDSRLYRVIDNAVKTLNSFASAIDVAVSYDPGHAALPWAVVRSILHIMSSGFELKHQMFAGIAMISPLLVLCDLYQQIYMAAAPDLRPPAHSLDSMKASIIKAYAASQVLLGTVIRQQGNKFATLAASFKLSSIQAQINEISSCENELRLVKDECESFCQLSSRSNVEDILKILANFPGIIRDQINLAIMPLNKYTRNELLKWISPIPYGEHHQRINRNRTHGTCEWLLSHPEFRKWNESNSSMILWLQGSPGAGKTFLTSKVIEYTQTQLKGSPVQGGFAFFYCDRNEDQRRKPLSVLQSYVRQLSTTVDDTSSARSRLQDLHDKGIEDGSILDTDDCIDQLMESANLYCETILVLDALDECERSSRSTILETVVNLVLNAKNSVKVFISSRPDRDIASRFSNTPNIRIEATDNEEDVHRFVKLEIAKHENWHNMSLDLQNDIINNLFARSRGMFQWASLQVKQLLSLETERAIRDRLGKLPTGLKAAYDEIYGSIESLNKHDKALAKNAFKWVAGASEPLKSDRLLSAIRLDSDTGAFDWLDKVTELQLLHLCNNLLVIDSELHVWRFAHLSVAEYFEDIHWGSVGAQCHCAIVCLKLLLRPSYSKSGSEEKDTNDASDLAHPLQRYVQQNWMDHVQSQEGQNSNPLLTSLLKSFLGSPEQSSLYYQGWHHITRYRALFPSKVAIFAMCHFSFYTTLSDWWEFPTFDISQQNHDNNNLLTIAIPNSSKELCQRLIELGINVNSPDGNKYGSALMQAACLGRWEVVPVLLHAGADVNMQLNHGNDGSALAAAAHRNHTKTAGLLIQGGADVNMPLSLCRNSWGSALNAAVYQDDARNAEIVQLLLQAGADPNMRVPDHNGSSPLMSAVITDSKTKAEVVQLLLEAGADPNMQYPTREFPTVLATAATGSYKGMEEVIPLLIQGGADVNMQLPSESQGSALAIAAAAQDTKIVELLLQGGVDIDLPLINGRYGSALAVSSSARRGYWVAELLVKAGANVDMQLSVGNFGSALIAAAAAIDDYDYEEVDCAMSPGSIAMAYANLAATAPFNSNMLKQTGCLWPVLKGGAKINQQVHHGIYGSALAAAAFWGATECVEVLIANGADVNLRIYDRPFQTALQACQAEVTEEYERDRGPRREDDRLAKSRAEVAEILRKHGATDEVEEV